MIPEFIYIPVEAPSSDNDNVRYSYVLEVPQSPSSCTCSVHTGTHNKAEVAEESERWKATERKDVSQQSVIDESPKVPSRQCRSQSLTCPKQIESRRNRRAKSIGNSDDAKTMPPKMPRRIGTSTNLANMWEINHHKSPSNSQELSLSEHSSCVCVLQLPASNVALTGDIGPIRVSNTIPPRNIDILNRKGTSDSAPSTGKVDRKAKEQATSPLVASPPRKSHPYDSMMNQPPRRQATSSESSNERH